MDVSYKYTTVCEVECLVGSQGGKVDVDGFFLLLVSCECGPRSLAFLIISFLIQARALLLCEEANFVVSRRGELATYHIKTHFEWGLFCFYARRQILL